MNIGPTQKNAIVLAATGLLVGAFLVLLVGTFNSPQSAPVAAHKTQVAQVRRMQRHRPRRRIWHPHSPRKAPAPVAVASRPTVDGLPVEFPQPTKITISLAPTPQFVKLGGSDHPLEKDARHWQCVRDRTTGLVWETKTHDRGLRDAQNFYSWYDPTKASNGGDAGVPDHGKCRGGIACDTHAYIEAVNRMKLCGYSDWRLPTRAELSTLIEYHASDAAQGQIDTHYFPADSSGWYWSADSDHENPHDAWYVLYYNGREMKAPKSQAKRIRLVRGPVWSPTSMTAKRPLSDASARKFAGGKKKTSSLLANSHSTQAVD